MGRGARLGRARLPRLLPLRRAADGAALGAGSLLLWRKHAAGPVALLYAGLAVGIATAVPVHGSFGTSDIPAAQDHLDFVPARLVALLGNTLGTAAVLVVAAATFRRRPLGNTLIVLGVAIAAIGSALAGLGASSTARFGPPRRCGRLVPGFTMRARTCS